MDTTPVNPLVIEANVIEALQTVFDPEIPVSIWEIGLIYGIKVDPSGAVGVRMTLTSPNCPSAAELPQEVESKVRAIGGVTAATVEVVFDPPWRPSMMSEAAKLQLNMWHGAQFNVKDGQVLRPPAPMGVSSYPVRITNGAIEVEV
jgi:FeS assembly SUF system protein